MAGSATHTYTWHADLNSGDDATTVRLSSDDDQASILSIDPSSIIVITPSDQENYNRLYHVDTSKGDITSLEMILAKDLPQETTQAFAPVSSAPAVTSPSSGLHVTFVISTESGAKQAASFFKDQLKPLLDKSGHFRGYEVFTTENVDSITQVTTNKFVQRANNGDEQLVVLLSGDGGPIDLVNACYDIERSPRYRSPLLATLPFGTGNALSHSYGYTKDKTGGLSTLFRGKSRPLPTFRVSFSSGARLVVDEGRELKELTCFDGRPTLRGLVVCSWGLHSTLVADSDTAHYRQFGAQRFQMVAKQLLYPEDGSQHHGYKGRITLNGAPSSIDRDHHSYVLVTLVSNLEKTFCISPDSKSLDGKLRLVEMPSMDGDELMKIMTGGYQDGKHIGMPGVGYHEIEGLRVDFDEPDGNWRRVCVDGKIVQMEEGGYFRLAKEDESVVDIATLP